MSFRFDIKPDLDLLYLRGAGTVTGRQVFRSLRIYADAPAFHPEIDTLFELAADATVEPGDDAVMDAVAETAQAARAQAAFRLAGVVRNSDHRTLFQTATAMLAPTAQVRPFSQLPKALSWLGHGKSDLPPLDLKSGAPEPSFLPLSPSSRFARGRRRRRLLFLYRRRRCGRARHRSGAGRAGLRARADPAKRRPARAPARSKRPGRRARSHRRA
jgi:hypothetical protein